MEINIPIIYTVTGEKKGKNKNKNEWRSCNPPVRAAPALVGRETPYLPRGLDALNDGHADDDPGAQQGQGHPPVEAARVVDAAGDVEGLPVPEVGGGRALLTLWLHD